MFTIKSLGVCPKRRTHARGNVISCIQDTSRAVSNAVCSFQCGRKPFGLLPQGMRLRHPCRRLGKLDTALELRHGKETAASCIMMQSMTIPLAVRLDNLSFPGRLLESVFAERLDFPYVVSCEPEHVEIAYNAGNNPFVVVVVHFFNVDVC